MPTKEFFSQFPNKYFIETGTCWGGSTQNALDSGCFTNIYTIELGKHLYRHACKKFSAFPNVHVLLGDSQMILPALLQKIDAPATFWLDGHYSGGNTVRSNCNSPIVAEIKSICSHHIKTHTIIIDDVRSFGTIWFDYIKIEDVIAKIRLCNSRYQISYVDGNVPNDILIARVDS